MSTPKDRDSLSLMAEGRQADEWLTTDCVEYIADMAEELKELADRGGLQTLAGILGLAAAEARNQASRREGQR